MSITEYGHVVREMREKIGGISLRQMAEEIGLSSTYVSAVEVGEKGITDEFVEKVVGFFRKRRVSTRDIAKLHASVDRTRRTVNVEALDGTGRQAVAAFARRWADLDRVSRAKFLRKLDVQPKDENE